jgi:hypothetical protein
MLRPLSFLVLVFAAAPLAALAACSSDPETSPGSDAGDAPAQDAAAAETADDDAAAGDDAGTEAAADAGSDFCSAIAARAAKCGDDPPTDCAKQEACYAKLLRPTVADSAQQCLPARACDTSDDSCFEEASKPFHDDPAVTAYMTSCNAKRTACGDALPEDLCSPNMGAFKPAILADIDACLEEDCAGVLACIIGVFDDLGCAE